VVLTEYAEPENGGRKGDLWVENKIVAVKSSFGYVRHFPVLCFPPLLLFLSISSPAFSMPQICGFGCVVHTL